MFLSSLFLGVASGSFLNRRYDSVTLCRTLLFGIFLSFLAYFAGCYFFPGIRLVTVWLFLFGLTVETYIDIRHMIILDEILLVILFAGLGYRTACGEGWQEPLTGVVTGILVTGLIYIVSKGGFGLGDVKYTGVLGVWLGAPGILVCLALAFVTSGIAAVLLCVFRKVTLKSKVPFGPFLSLGAGLSFFYQPQILAWYLSWFL